MKKNNKTSSTSKSEALTHSRFKWRKINNILHRDFGYFFAGLTIIYAISGIAVNHIDDWNPNYIINRTTSDLKYKSLNNDNIKLILKDLGVKKKKDSSNPLKGKFSRSDLKKYWGAKVVQTDVNLTQIFLENKTISINTKTKKIQFESIEKRHIFQAFNKLHLNHIKGFWTYFADIYAVALILLSITGFFVLKGKKGLKWRGAILGISGLVIPIVVIFI